MPDKERMRCDPNLHPAQENMANRASCRSDGRRSYPTRLVDGEEVEGHDDWSCLDDAVAEGLLLAVGTGLQPAYVLTDTGRRVAAKLRAHKQNGGGFGTFAKGGAKGGEKGKESKS